MLDPGQSQLTGCHILLGRQLLDVFHQLQVLLKQLQYKQMPTRTINKMCIQIKPCLCWTQQQASM